MFSQCLCGFLCGSGGSELLFLLWVTGGLSGLYSGLPPSHSRKSAHLQTPDQKSGTATRKKAKILLSSTDLR